ncbi:HTH domain-containing protein [Sulfitobacter pontiacus]|uniref:HTH domain-containing protein n=1 Tax=Sulfitobacter pontiacus TaxID=60137 RepID=UPI0030EB4278
MDSYLQIARAVLKSTRRPMSARAILDFAYKADVVPTHLFGKTQQKTLQARLSEDILNRRDTTEFYRTEPGQFFLAEFLEDPEIPEQWKRKFPARRRTRDLKRDNTLGVKKSFLKNCKGQTYDFHDFFVDAEAKGALNYLHPDDMSDLGYCKTWTFSMVLRDDCVLAYRIGRYRDNRDAFANKRSIGFPGTLAIDDVSLFSTDRLGAQECSVSVLIQDLDLSVSTFDGHSAQKPVIDRVLIVETANFENELVILLNWECPSWFEPTTRRLSLNEPQWLCTSARPNDLEDFEPWSSHILANWLASEAKAEFGKKNNLTTTNRFSKIRIGK